MCAVAPYLSLKVLWLAGTNVGLAGGADTTEMHGARLEIGNAATAAMELLAVFFAVALTSTAARRVPGWVVLVPGGGATGFLAPIVLGLPLGVSLQALISGNVSTGGEGDLEPWVFVTVYGGFGLLGISLGHLFLRYVLDRWQHLWAAPPTTPARWARAIGSLGMLPFGIAMLAWGLCGPGATGPRGMGAPEQRTVLVVTGLLVLGGYLIPLISQRAFAIHPRFAWAIAWAGCTSAVCQGMTHILLARDGHPQPLTVAVGLAATPAGLVYGLAVLRDRVGQTTNSGQEWRK